MDLMGGAYVAKPAATTSVDVPPGWNPDWPRPGDTDRDPNPFFPAPLPPGYTPSYSLAMTATDSISFDAAASVTGSLRDYTTYTTNEPEDSEIIWTASVNGAVVQLKFTGGVLANSISSTVAYAATYWGAAPSIEFDLTVGNEGDTLTLTGASVIDGITVTQTEEITIIQAFSIEINASANITSFDPSRPTTYSAEISVRLDEVVNETGQRGSFIVRGGAEARKFESTTVTQGTAPSEPVATADSDTIIGSITASELAQEGFDLSVLFFSAFTTTTYSIDITTRDSENEVVDTQTAAVSLSSSEGWGTSIWVLVDGTTGLITVENAIP